MQLTPRDLYRLRRVRLSVQRATLRAQMAQQELQEITLDLEQRYGLLVKAVQLDMQTGAITEASANGATKEVSCGPANDADTGTP